MKIAFISAAKSIHIVRWANAMVKKGHEVVIISCANDVLNVDSGYEQSVRVVALTHSTPLGYYLNAHQLRCIVKKEKFDVINVHYASGYGTLGRRSKLKNALLNVWGSDVYDFPYQSSFKMKLIKKNLKHFKYVASTSNCMAKQAKKLVDRDYFITPFGVDTDLFKPMPELKPVDEVIFGTVKTLSPKYGVADTIKAFIKLVHRLEEENHSVLVERLSYEIYGRGELKDELQKLIDDNLMHNKIKLCGYIDNKILPKIYNRFTVFNCNSISDSESFGVAAVEAMACGIPVQVSDADGFTEVVEEGITGLIAPKGDIDIIAENMYKLLMNSDMCKQMSIAGVERVKRLYDWQNNVDYMEDIYFRISAER